ncbi:MAG TPA: hypothetical protein VNK82_04965 [Terriglobales bacterium]|nr:hypothetical protein [Terriglobales bacterium]
MEGDDQRPNRASTYSRSLERLDVYLGVVCTFSSMLTIAYLWNGPPTDQHLKAGLVSTTVTLLCILFARRKLLMIGAAMGFMALRGLMGVMLNNHPKESLAIAAVAGLATFFIAKAADKRYERTSDGTPTLR